MWFLAIFTLLNSALHQYAVVNKFRISLGIVQLGIIEGMLAFGFLLALIRGSHQRALYPPLRTHPLVVWTLAPMLIAVLFGLLMGLAFGNMPKFLMSSAREFFAIPMCFLMGYRLLGTPRHARIMARVMIIAGLFTGFALLYNFGEQTEEAALTGSLNVIRSTIINWNSDYPAIAALVLVFVVLTRQPLWNTLVCMAVGIFCYIAYASTLSRVGFLVLAFGTASIYLLLPKGERLGKFLRSLVFIPVLAFSCWGAVWLGDQIIGRNFAGKVGKHIQTLLPGERTGSNEKAWDSRLGGIEAELGIWIKNPLIGSGFGTGESHLLTGNLTVGGASIKHNSWTSTMAETGMFGLTGIAVMIASMLLIGYRMVHDRTDPTWVLFGALGFITGLITFLRFSATYGITSRAAIGFAMVAGMLMRCREMQETQIALARQNAYQDQYAYVDQDTGLLVPDYGYELGHFGTN